MFEYEAKLLRTVDGDTLDLQIDLGFSVSVEERFRVYGINAPETHSKDANEKTAGLATMAFVDKILRAQTTPIKIKTHKDDKEKYGRYLAEVFVRDDENGKRFGDDKAPLKSVGDYLIEKKLAKAYFGGART